MSPPVHYCSFCGKEEREVFYLVAGPTVYICDECVVLAADVIQDRRTEAAVAVEREACAQIAAGHLSKDDAHRLAPWHPGCLAAAECCEEIAADIRARAAP